MNDNMPSNSNKSRAELPLSVNKAKPATDIKPIAPGRKVKRTFIQNALDNLTEDSDNFKMNVMDDYVKPAISNTVLDIVSAVMNGVINSFEIALFGKSSGRRIGRRGYQPYGAQYRTSSDSGRATIIRGSEDQGRPINISHETRTLHDFSNIIFDDPNCTQKENKEKADDVLEILENLIDTFGVATVAQFYQACEESFTHQDMNWGWKSLIGARTINLRGNAVAIELPKPVYIDNNRRER